jgi:hypothetical protein
MTLVELTVAVALLSVGMVGFLEALVTGLRLSTVLREQALAQAGARSIIETLRGTPISQVFATYNADPGDDPGGANTAPGQNLAVLGLQARTTDADGRVALISFPTNGVGAAATLSENVVDARFGTPRDLNGDGAIDANNHSNDYKLLPVVVRLEWRGPAGDGQLEMRTLLSGY